MCTALRPGVWPPSEYMCECHRDPWWDLRPENAYHYLQGVWPPASMYAGTTNKVCNPPVSTTPNIWPSQLRVKPQLWEQQRKGSEAWLSISRCSSVWEHQNVKFGYFVKYFQDYYSTWCPSFKAPLTFASWLLGPHQAKFSFVPAIPCHLASCLCPNFISLKMCWLFNVDNMVFCQDLLFWTNTPTLQFLETAQHCPWLKDLPGPSRVWSIFFNISKMSTLPQIKKRI